MDSSDTVNLLRECDAGTKMAVTSIDEVLDKVSDQHLTRLLIDNKNHHSELGNKLHGLLMQHGSDEKDPNPVAKGMSWIKTNIKTSIKESDSAITDLITDGCNMGIKSLNKYLNQYKNADSTSKSVCNELIQIEEKLAHDLRGYL